MGIGTQHISMHVLQKEENTTELKGWLMHMEIGVRMMEQYQISFWISFRTFLTHLIHHITVLLRFSHLSSHAFMQKWMTNFVPILLLTKWNALSLICTHPKPQVQMVSQYSFIKRLSLSLEIIFVQLLYHKRSKWGYVAPKLDMSKAYDQVEWLYLEALMHKLGFSEQWVKLIIWCISLVSYSFNLNQNVVG